MCLRVILEGESEFASLIMQQLQNLPWPQTISRGVLVHVSPPLLCLCRQLAFALGAMQAVTAWVLLKGLCAGAVQASAYAWCHIALAAAGACFCLVQAATATSTTTQQLWAGSAASSSQAAGVDGSLFGPVAATTLECEKREHTEPEYAAFTSAAVLLLTLLQLAL